MLNAVFKFSLQSLTHFKMRVRVSQAKHDDWRDIWWFDMWA